MSYEFPRPPPPATEGGDAPPPPPTEQPAKRRRRWPWMVGAIVVVAIIGAVTARAGDDKPRRFGSTATTTTAAPERSETTKPETTTTAERDEFVVGDRMETARGNFVQVFSYEQPVLPPDGFTPPSTGQEFAVIDVEACAGPTDEAGRAVNPFDFELVMPDNTRRQAEIPVREPALNYVELPKAGDCARGFVSFQVPAGQRPAYIKVDQEWSDSD